MGLIHIPFTKLIPVSILDVHPPFYYIALKCFVMLTTFWTKSIFIKVIISRIFSFICLILFIICVIKLLKVMDININYNIQILLFLISPGVINESMKIRMYSLSSLLLIFELYQLVLFVKRHKILNILLATIMAILASYTFYPLAISSGLFLFLFFIYEIINKNKKDYLLLITSGISMIILYLPWISNVIKQIKYHSNHDGALVNNYFYIIINSITQLNAQSPSSSLLKYMSMVSIIVIILFIFLIAYSFIHSSKIFNKILLITMIDFITTLFLSVIVCKRQFRVTIIYPIYSILISLLIVILIVHLPSLKNIHIFRYLMLLTGIIFVTYSMAACINNIKMYDIPSVKLVKNFDNWKSTKSKRININKFISIYQSGKKVNGNATYATQDADYLGSLNKEAVINVSSKIGYKEFISGLSNSKYNYVFFHKLYPNLKYKK